MTNHISTIPAGTIVTAAHRGNGFRTGIVYNGPELLGTDEENAGWTWVHWSDGLYHIETVHSLKVKA